MKKLIRGIESLSVINDNVKKLQNNLSIVENRLADLCINNILANPKYKDPKKLNNYEYQVFSQNGEDGIIKEIFNRIGITNKFFVEFGVGGGIENNTTSLLIDEWNGVWIEADLELIKYINERFSREIHNKKLKIKHSFVDAQNIQDLFKEMAVPTEFDLLSIDIDGNDYWVWDAIKDFSPRVIIVEYNASYGPNLNWIMEYDPNYKWDDTSYFGASLKAFEILANSKGYKLVGCNTLGINSFFVKEELVGDKFAEPFTSENHYEPPRYYLQRNIGHPRNFGSYKKA